MRTTADAALAALIALIRIWAVALATTTCSDHTDTEPGKPDSSTIDAGPTCATDCEPCPTGSHCLKGGSLGQPIIPACLKLCNATDECEAGEICLIPGLGCGPSPKANAYCVSATLPAPCGEQQYAHCDYFGYAECRDDETLMTGVDRIGVFTGLKLDHCPAGCNGSPLDGGAYPAKCN